jgi:hypothetical protein
MEKMKTLADQLREQLVTNNKQPHKSKAQEKKFQSTILDAIMAYDNSMNKSMVHARFDPQTLKLMNHFKMATGVDVTKMVAFAVKYLFENNPELKTIIKHFIQNTEL